VAEAVGVGEAAIRRSAISLRFRGELPPEPTKRVSRLTQLTQLGQLRTSGVLTDAEFESEKARVLAWS